jgi:hypothetical protein
MRVLNIFSLKKSVSRFYSHNYFFDHQARIVTHGELYEEVELRGIEFVSMLHDDSNFFQRQVLMTVQPCEHVLVEVPVLRRGRVAWHR